MRGETPGDQTHTHTRTIVPSRLLLHLRPKSSEINSTKSQKGVQENLTVLSSVGETGNGCKLALCDPGQVTEPL